MSSKYSKALVVLISVFTCCNVGCVVASGRPSENVGDKSNSAWLECDCPSDESYINGLPERWAEAWSSTYVSTIAHKSVQWVPDKPDVVTVHVKDRRQGNLFEANLVLDSLESRGVSVVRYRPLPDADQNSTDFMEGYQDLIFVASSGNNHFENAVALYRRCPLRAYSDVFRESLRALNRALYNDDEATTFAVENLEVGIHVRTHRMVLFDPNKVYVRNYLAGRDGFLDDVPDVSIAYGEEFAKKKALMLNAWKRLLTNYALNDFMR